MGCASSKKIGATTPDVYRPSSTSFAVFDINAIEEPWLKLETPLQLNPDSKSSHLPPPILEKLSSFEQQPSDAPRTWGEISKALEDLKPVVAKAATAPPKTSPAAQPTVSLDDMPGPALPNKQAPSKSLSFHTVEELDTKLNAGGSFNANKQTELRKTESTRGESTRSEMLKPESPPGKDSGGFKPVRDNVFILRDRMEREREGKARAFDRNKGDPLSQFPEKCPPGGASSVVLYTTSLRGVRRTFEDCNTARSVLETHRVIFDERDVSLHAEFLNELRELVGSEEAEGGGGMVPVPRLFVKGRYLGGVEEVVELNESGRLGRILNWARVERGVQGCEGCGWARFVPCLECGGSCKVLVGDKGEKERCPKCNENGLVQCPLCH